MASAFSDYEPTKLKSCILQPSTLPDVKIMADKRSFWIITGVTLFLWCFPYILGYLLEGEAFVFGGLLFNPIDGNSYLAKMRIGWEGNWIFRLPYTPDPGDGAYLFLIYILLGHISRLLSLPLVATFHITRLLAGFFLAWMCWKFTRTVLKDQAKQGWWCFSLVLLGSGMGWLFSLILGVTADLWVAEAYPFLSGYANPHFPLGIGMILHLLLAVQKQNTKWGWILLGGEGVALSSILPFGMVVLTAVLLGLWIWDLILTKRIPSLIPLLTLIPGGLFLIYQFAVIQLDAVLAQWNAQNLTPSPPVWDLIISLSPALVLAAFGVWKMVKTGNFIHYRIALIWFGVGILLSIIPFSLQRRFLLGIYIPTAVIAIYAIGSMPKRLKKRYLPVTLIFSALTNVFILSASFFGIQSKSPYLYITQTEAQSIQWLAENVKESALVLTSPELGIFIPARSQHRVIYGHPMETIQADEQRKALAALLSQKLSEQEFGQWVSDRKVQFVLWGPRERAYEGEIPGESLIEVFRNQDVTVYKILDEQK